MKTFNQFTNDIVEAAGDPIKPEQVISLDDPVVQQNLRNAIVKPNSSTDKKRVKVDPITKFIQRIRTNTLLTPL